MAKALGVLIMSLNYYVKTLLESAVKNPSQLHDGLLHLYVCRQALEELSELFPP